MTMATDHTQTFTVADRLGRFMRATREALVLVFVISKTMIPRLTRRDAEPGRAPLGQLGGAGHEPLAGRGLDVHHVIRCMRSAGHAL